MLEIIAWIGCVLIVLSGASIYLSSLGDESPELRRSTSLVVLVVSVILAGVFAYLIMQEAAKTPSLEASYKNVQDSLKNSFDATSRILEETTGSDANVASPAQETANAIEEAAGN